MADNNGSTGTRTLAEFNDTSGYLSLYDLELRLNWGIGFGIPIDIDNNGAAAGQHVAEIRGSWVTVSITGTTGTVVLNHNLNIPPTSVTGAGGTANLPNCRWFLVGLEFGDRTGATAPPAAPAAHTVSFLKMSNGTVTADAITLQYAVAGFAPDATHPLTVTFFVVAAAI